VSGPGVRSPRRQPETAYADTNVFIALLVGPGHPLHEPALSIFRRVADGELVLVVTPVIVAELVYVGRALLQWKREVAAARLGELVSADGLVVAEAATVQLALWGAVQVGFWGRLPRCRCAAGGPVGRRLA
jgi:predicted nucleic acid-binding protein